MCFVLPGRLGHLPKDQAGIGLLEAILTMLVISVAFVALLRLEAALWHAQTSIEDMAQAIQLAREKLDEIHEFPGHADTSYNVVIHANRRAYHLVWWTTATENETLHTQRVSVEWDDAGQTRTLRVEARNLPPPSGFTRTWTNRLD